MSDTPSQPVPEAAEPTPQERLAAAGEAFGALNRTLPAGLPPFQIPDLLQPSAGLDALVGILIDKGLLDPDEFVLRKTERMAEMVESFTEQAREVKRQVTGLVIAGENPRI